MLLKLKYRQNHFIVFEKKNVKNCQFHIEQMKRFFFNHRNAMGPNRKHFRLS